VKKVTLDDIFDDAVFDPHADTPDGQEFRVWDNQPGGIVVRRWQEKGVKYVGVEFEQSPGMIYTYLQGTR
jgi:hypothetical protein